jgi:hypothetical protein
VHLQLKCLHAWFSGRLHFAAPAHPYFPITILALPRRLNRVGSSLFCLQICQRCPSVTISKAYVRETVAALLPWKLDLSLHSLVVFEDLQLPVAGLIDHIYLDTTSARTLLVLDF